MALFFKGGGLNAGSLLRRTLLHVATFALGSLAFITIVSFLLVSVVKSVLPTQNAIGAGSMKEEGIASNTELSAKPALPTQSAKGAGGMEDERIAWDTGLSIVKSEASDPPTSDPQKALEAYASRGSAEPPKVSIRRRGKPMNTDLDLK